MYPYVRDPSCLKIASRTLSSVLISILFTADLAFADAVVRQLSGQVEIGRGEPPAWAVLQVGHRIASNERIRTGPDGRVELEIDAGILRVHENSLLSLPPSLPDTDKVELERGHSLFDILRRSQNNLLDTDSLSVVSALGLLFALREIVIRLMWRELERRLL